MTVLRGRENEARPTDDELVDLWGDDVLVLSSVHTQPPPEAVKSVSHEVWREIGEVGERLHPLAHVGDLQQPADDYAKQA